MDSISNRKNSIRQSDDLEYDDEKEKTPLRNNIILLEEELDQNGEQIMIAQSPDTQKIIQYLEEDLKHKNDFLLTDEANNYIQLIVISLLRMNSINDDLFLTHIQNVTKAIKIATKTILSKQKMLISEEDFNENVFIQNTIIGKNDQNSFIKIFYQDVNINFITSTGQIKSTAFIFVSKEIAKMLHKETQEIRFETLQLKLTLTFFNPSEMPFLGQNTVYSSCKSSAIKNNTFSSFFLILKESREEEVRSGITIYFVYKPADDQIYAIKKVEELIFILQSKFQKILTPMDFITNHSFQVENDQDKHKIHEAKILSKLTHPNILKLYDWWIETENDASYLYMQLEYCCFPGYNFQPQNLLEYGYYIMNKMGTQEKLHTIKNIMKQILGGLEYIHKRGILHRDLKPENVFVTINILGELQVMLADFDHSKDLREEKLQSGEGKFQIKEEQPKTDWELTEKENEFRELGIILLHLILTFPGKPEIRRNYIKMFESSDPDDLFGKFSSYAQKYVRNKHEEFLLINFKSVLLLARKLISKKLKDHQEIKNAVEEL